MLNYRIAIFPSKHIQDAANSHRKRYDPRYALIPPHITLKESFKADDEQINELIPELKSIANATKPFTININKISDFAPVTNAIYFKVEPIQALTDLNDKMHQGKFSQDRKHPFVPHITIAQDISEGEFHDINGSLQMKDIKFEDHIDRFHLLYQLENGSWTVYDSFVFGRE